MPNALYLSYETDSRNHLPDSLKCLVMSLLQRRRRSKHHQDTTAIGNKRMTCLVESLMTLALKLLERRTHVINTDRRILENLIDTIDLETLCTNRDNPWTQERNREQHQKTTW